jgi:hypothetical protein
MAASKSAFFSGRRRRQSNVLRKMVGVREELPSYEINAVERQTPGRYTDEY